MFRKQYPGAAFAGRLPLVLPALMLLGITSAAGQAVLAESEFSFGKVSSGEVLEHAFVLKNPGADAVRIASVSLTPPLQLGKMPAVIPAGSQVVLNIKLPTGELSGLFEGGFSVRLNGSEVHAAISAEITPLIEVLPRPAIILAGQRGRAADQSVEIVNHDAEPVTLLKVEHPTERFTTELETIEAGKRFRLTLRLKPDGPGGRAAESIVIRTSSAKSPQVKILAATYLREKVYTFPETVDFGAPPLAAVRKSPDAPGLTQTLMIYRPGTTGFEVHASSDAPQIRLRTEPGPQGDRYQITVTLDPKAVAAGPLDTSITLKTNDPEFPVVKVPVTGRIVQ